MDRSPSKALTASLTTSAKETFLLRAILSTLSIVSDRIQKEVLKRRYYSAIGFEEKNGFFTWQRVSSGELLDLACLLR